MLTPAEIARLFGRSIGSIYVLASRERWHRRRIAGRLHYDAIDVLTTLDRFA